MATIQRLWQYEIGDCGIELEFMQIYRQSRSFLNNVDEALPGYKILHDASSESLALDFGGIPAVADALSDDDIKFLRKLGFGDQIVIGGEITSPILVDSEWKNNVYKLCEVLRKFGESENTIRDSLHVHLNVGDSVPLRVLQRLLSLVCSYEAIIYRLAGLGRVNRGQENQYTYQRPYLGRGPIVVLKNDAYVPILNVNDLLSAKSKAEFFERYGSADVWGKDKTRYVTMRYMGLNFYSIMIQGSIEFRYANKTVSPEWLIAWTNFCKAILKKAFFESPTPDEDIIRPLYKNKVIKDNDFINVLNGLPLDDDTREILFQIWLLSPTPTFDNVYRTSHLDRPTFFVSTYTPRNIPAHAVVEKALFLDVHHLQRGQNVLDRGRDVAPKPPVNPYQNAYDAGDELDFSTLKPYTIATIETGYHLMGGEVTFSIVVYRKSLKFSILNGRNIYSKVYDNIEDFQFYDEENLLLDALSPDADANALNEFLAGYVKEE